VRPPGFRSRDPLMAERVSRTSGEPQPTTPDHLTHRTTRGQACAHTLDQSHRLFSPS